MKMTIGRNNAKKRNSIFFSCIITKKGSGFLIPSLLYIADLPIVYQNALRPKIAIPSYTKATSIQITKTIGIKIDQINTFAS